MFQKGESSGRERTTYEEAQNRIWGVGRDHEFHCISWVPASWNKLSKAFEIPSGHRLSKSTTTAFMTVWGSCQGAREEVSGGKVISDGLFLLLSVHNSYHSHRHCRWRNYCHQPSLSCLCPPRQGEMRGDMEKWWWWGCVYVCSHTWMYTLFCRDSCLLYTWVTHLEKHSKTFWNIQKNMISVCLPSIWRLKLVF